ncbi:MAG TPA: hypothetical protein VIV60_09760, partial [Polyangiaceae bacterium]
MAADVLACCSVFGSLWAMRRLFRDLPWWTSYLLAPFVLTSGVLGWSIWSGMELALFLGIWGGTAHLAIAAREATYADQLGRCRWGLALLGLLLVITRPEALVCIVLFAAYACLGPEDKDNERWRPFVAWVAPAVGFTVLRALLNLVLTGSVADAGALVKLYPLRPFLDAREVSLKWFANIGFQLSRISVYHTSDTAAWCWQLWLLLGLALIPKRTRATVVLLILQALCWIVVVAQNEYVRYQNDRYTMPALFFLLVAVALGMGALVARIPELVSARGSRLRLSTAMLGAGASVSFLVHQLPRLDQQHWLFGRACRNIAEQQIRVGQLFRAGQFGPTRRVLLGDAGAIPYFSGLAGTDAIGLGGTHGLPFAKAVNLGVGATVELIERLSPDERPDKMAIYPSWWDLLPLWFGRRIDEVRIHGNVICGAPDKAIYETEWRGLTEFSRPASLLPNVRIVDELDFADVVSESAHGYRLSSKHSGYVVMNILPDAADPSRDLFDAGR